MYKYMHGKCSQSLRKRSPMRSPMSAAIKTRIFSAWGEPGQEQLLHGASLADTLDQETNHV